MKVVFMRFNAEMKIRRLFSNSCKANTKSTGDLFDARWIGDTIDVERKKSKNPIKSFMNSEKW